jgi:hypothetical protein
VDILKEDNTEATCESRESVETTREALDYPRVKDILNMMKSLEEKNRWQRDYRTRTDNVCTKKYEKTPNGFLMRMYRNMQNRIKGIQKLKSHLYKGKDLLNKEDFYNWAKTSESFWKLFTIWIEKNYDRKLTPTVDRINSKEGYHLSNMEWVTHSENSRRGSISKHKMKI